MNNIFLILAKSNSVGLKNKNLLKINSLTLLEAEMKKAKQANVFQKFYISSDSEEILSIGKTNQFDTIKRNVELTKNIAYLDSVKHAVNSIPEDVATITISQVVQPLKGHKIYQKIMNEHRPGIDSVVTVTKFNSSPNWIYRKNERSTLDKVNYINYENIIAREDDLYEIDNKIVSFTYDSFKKWNSITPWPYLGNNIKCVEDVVINQNLRVDINNSEDLEWYKLVIKKFFDE